VSTVVQHDLDRQLIDARAVADMLGVTPRWVEEHGRSGVLPSFKLGGARRYKRSAILAGLAAQEEGGQ
jgi:hypothetical protein